MLTEALQDLRALELLERSTSRDAVIALLEDGLAQELSFEAYPREVEWYIRKREEINRLIGEHANSK